MKFCGKCGNSLDDDAVKCELCGEMQISNNNAETQPSTDNADVQYDNSQTQNPNYNQNVNYSGQSPNYNQGYNGQNTNYNGQPQSYNQGYNGQNPNYGQPNQGYNQPYNGAPYNRPYNMYPPKRNNTACIVGFVLAFVSFFIPFASIVGVIFSIVGVKNFNPETETGRGMGIAGIVINGLVTLGWIIGIIIFVVIIGIASSSGYYY